MNNFKTKKSVLKSQNYDLLVDILEKNKNYQKTKQKAYKGFYYKNISQILHTDSHSKNFFEYGYLNFFKAFSSMCLVALLVSSTWIFAENLGLIKSSIIHRPVIQNNKNNFFDDCLKKGGTVIDKNGLSCIIEKKELQPSIESIANSN